MGELPITAASVAVGVIGFMKAALGLRLTPLFFFAALFGAAFFADFLAFFGAAFLDFLADFFADFFFVAIVMPPV
jgi:hypothetical protein